MVYKLREYRRVIVPQIVVWFKDNPKKRADILNEISHMAIASQCPIVVLCHLMEEVFGEIEGLKEKTKGLEVFYKVDNVEKE